MNKQNQGITLIALVVTIIVLLILAGVSIAMVLGQDGILKKAQTASARTDESQEIEQVRMAVLEAKTNYVTGDKSKTLKEELEESIKKVYPEATVKKSGTGEYETYTITLSNGNQYKVYADGNIMKTEPIDPTEVWYKIEDTTLHLSKSDLGGYTKNEQQRTPSWISINKSVTKIIIENEIVPTDTSYWFNHTTNLTEIGSRVNDEYIPNDLRNLNTSKVTSMAFMFSEIGLENLDLSSFDTSSVTQMGGMFYQCSNLTSLDLSSFDTSNVTSMWRMFYQYGDLTSLNLSSFDTSSVTDMSGMFSQCSNLTNLDLSSFDTSSVTDMSSMFSQCSNLTNLDLSNFDTSSVTDMSEMFYECRHLTSLNLSSFDTSNVTKMRSMFSQCRYITNLDLSSFDTSNVTDMRSVFYWCGNLTSLNLSSFNTSSVKNMESMFSECIKLTSLNLGSFDTSSVTDMSSMFSQCSNLTNLDLSSFDTSNVTDMKYMLVSVKGPISVGSKWTLTESDTNYYGIFEHVRN